MDAELSSVATALDELARRVTAIAEGYSEGRDDVATDLFEVERSLQGARRRLTRLVATLAQSRR